MELSNSLNQKLAWEVLDIPYYPLSDTVSIIEYSPEYFSKVHNLYLATYRKIASSVPEVQAYIRKSIKNTFETKSHELKKPEKNKLWIAVHSYDTVIGMIGLRVVSEDCFEVQKLAVAKNYRKKGISNQLWRRMEKEGRKLCKKRPLRICLSTISLLEVAESFYSRKGFKQIRKDKFKGYDLDVYERVDLSFVSSNKHTIARSQKYYHYYT